MAHFERIRDVVSGPFSPSIMQQRMAAGWQLVSIEWRRELPGDEAPSEGAFHEEIPYGLRISDDCQRLEFDPRERRVLTQMMDLVVQDFPFSSIASDLNEKGFRTRDDKLWNQVSVFKMLPRLIEIGPGLFSTAEWTARRERLSRTIWQDIPIYKLSPAGTAENGPGRQSWELAYYPLSCDLLSSATTPMTTSPPAQIASITNEVEIKSSAAR
jgi:hypothetical protein